MMRVWENREDWGVDNLELVERPSPGPPAAGQIKVKMRAASVNYRDLVTISNSTPFGKLPQIPFSDGCGEVIAAGESVTRFSVGDHVCPTFFPSWIDGPPGGANRAVSLGSASAPGLLQEEIVLDAEHAVLAPANLTSVEAATLPCAGLTAWRAVSAQGNVRKGEIVLVQGTGGVSIFALQFAKMLGARVIVTSSSEEKLDRARALGADHLINYSATPEWGKAVLEITNGRGADLIVEVGGAGTISESLIAAAINARIMVVGVLGGRSQELLMPVIFGKNLHIQGISVGSRAMFEQMVDVIVQHDLHPVVDQVFPFGQVPDALRAMKAANHFGKIAIDFVA
jgi:NADPH:quinone reductase and related Zn-dependent oxidoreductases